MGLTLLHVRNAGQFSHNEVELEKFRRVYAARGIAIESVVFEFSGRNPSLSWHLTQKQKDAIDDHWNALKSGDAWKAVKCFLQAG